jgi:hypothetical protein
MEDDENDIDMSAILNPKLSSTRIERPRRVPVATSVPSRTITSESHSKHKNQSNSLTTGERAHSDIIEKVLAGIPLTENDIRKVIHRKKSSTFD